MRHYPIVVCGAGSVELALVRNAMGVFQDVVPLDGHVDFENPLTQAMSALVATGEFGEAALHVIKSHPRAMFIAVKRDPRVLMARSQDRGLTVEQALDEIESSLAQREIIIQNIPNSFYLIRYEDLLGNPDGLQRTLAQLLGATYEQPLSRYLVYLGYTPGELDSHKLIDMRALRPELRDRLTALVRREGYEHDDRWAEIP